MNIKEKIRKKYSKTLHGHSKQEMLLLSGHNKANKEDEAVDFNVYLIPSLNIFSARNYSKCLAISMYKTLWGLCYGGERDKF